MRYCFDIDGTICETEAGSYQDSVPKFDRIARVNGLHDAGHTIIYFTARGTTTGIDWAQFTTDQLESWGAKYHSLILGKPEADIYVDDRGANSEDFEWD